MSFLKKFRRRADPLLFLKDHNRLIGTAVGIVDMNASAFSRGISSVRSANGGEAQISKLVDGLEAARIVAEWQLRTINTAMDRLRGEIGDAEVISASPGELARLQRALAPNEPVIA